MKRVKVNRFGFHCFEMFSVLNTPRNISRLKIRCT